MKHGLTWFTIAEHQEMVKLEVKLSANSPIFNPLCIVTASVVYNNEQCLLFLHVTWTKKFSFIFCQQNRAFVKTTNYSSTYLYHRQTV